MVYWLFSWLMFSLAPWWLSPLFLSTSKTEEFGETGLPVEIWTFGARRINLLTLSVSQSMHGRTSLFFFVGLVMLYYAISDMFFLSSPSNSKNMLMDHPVLSFVSAGVNIFHAIGTFTNHACRCWPGYQLDVTGMYLVLMFPCVINLLHIHRNKNRSVDTSQSHRTSSTSTDPLAIIVALMCYIGLAFVLFLSTYIIEDPGLLVVLILTVMTSSFLLRWRHEQGVPRHGFLLAMALIFLALGYLSWLADRLRLVCSPTSPFQLHALWHVSTAGSLLVVYLHHRSEGHICLKSIFLDEKSHFG